MRFMIVDDEEVVRVTLRYLLQAARIECDTFEDGDHALAAFAATPERYAAVVTDLAMPGMRGTELAQRIWDRRPGMPVVILSGMLGDSRVGAGRGEDATYWLGKPAELEEILAALRSQGLDDEARVASGPRGRRGGHDPLHDTQGFSR